MTWPRAGWVRGDRAGQDARTSLACFSAVLPNYVLTQAAIAMDSERCHAVGAALVAATSLVLNFLVVPDRGVLGAAAVAIATEAVLGGVLYFGLRRVWCSSVS